MDAIKPKSSSNFFINSSAIFLLLSYLIFANIYDTSLIDEHIYILFFLYIIPIALFDLFYFKKDTAKATGLTAWTKHSPLRVAVKLWGLIGTMSIFVFCYWLFPVYTSNEYTIFFELVDFYIVLLALITIPYFIYIDGRMKEPEDAYYKVGCFFLGDFSKFDKEIFFEHFRSWFIKAYFLPIMSGYLLGNFYAVKNFDASNFHSFLNFFDFLILFIYIVDLTPAVVGYTFNLRLFDNHIISSDRYWFGWFSCIMCYTPFWTVLFYNNYFPYTDTPNWVHWTENNPVLHYCWAGIIVFLLTYYAFASVAFGLRWSNLTYRGIITNGPYSFTKHPAYIAKNLSWWFISMPFMIHTTTETAIKHCLMLIGINIIYTCRAMTEERHLSKFPEYVQYALYIEKHGALRFISRLFPYFRYYEGKYTLDTDSKFS